MHHGFAGARANLEIPLEKQRVQEAIQLTHDFFAKHLK